MVQKVYVLWLFFITGLIFSSAGEKYQEKETEQRNNKKSRLILDYNWPEPSKSLNRLPHPRSCHHFIHTKHDGSHVIKRCHGDKVFDYRHLRCHNKSSAKCWMDIVKKDLCYPNPCFNDGICSINLGKISCSCKDNFNGEKCEKGNVKKVKGNFSCPYPWGLYPDKEDCSRFYNCMGGKVFPRKCPDSTFFDTVEKICVNSNKALCARDSDIRTRDKTTSRPQLLFETTNKKEDWNTNINIITTIIDSKASETSGTHTEGSSEVENSSEEFGEKYHAKSSKSSVSKLSYFLTRTANPKLLRSTVTDSEENGSDEENSSDEAVKKPKSKIKYLTSKLSFTATSTTIPKLFRTTDANSKEDSSEEDKSSEEVSKKDRTKSKNKFFTSKQSFITTGTINPKSPGTTSIGSTEDSSEEENSSENVGGKSRTKSKNKFLTSKSSFSKTGTINSKSFKTTDVDTVKISSEDKDNKISPKYELKSTTPEIRTSSESNSINEIVPIATIMFTEKRYITPSSHVGHSSELPFQSSTIEPLVSTGDKFEPVTTTDTPEVSETDGNINDNINEVFWSTENISEEIFSSKKPFSSKVIDLATKSFTSDSSTIQLKTTETFAIESNSVATFSTLCPDFDGYIPHPNDKHLFIACIGGNPTVMECPKNLVYDSNTASCVYDKV